MCKDADEYWMEGSRAKEFPKDRTRIPTKERFTPPVNLREFHQNSEHASRFVMGRVK